MSRSKGADNGDAIRSPVDRLWPRGSIIEKTRIDLWPAILLWVYRSTVLSAYTKFTLSPDAAKATK
jgi:hypothetical protein